MANYSQHSSVWNIDIIKEYIKNNTNIKSIISLVYKNAYTKLEFECTCGNSFFKIWPQILRGETQCRECGYGRLGEQKRHSFEHVKNFIEIESDSGCTLLSTQNDYKNNTSILDLRCKCGSPFSTTFAYFRNDNKRTCDECTKKRIKAKFILPYEKIKNAIEIDRFKLLTTKKEYIDGTQQKLKIMCDQGHIFYKIYHAFLLCPKCPDCSDINFWNYDSVKNFIEVESDSECKLISSEYINNETKLEIKCACGNNFITDLSHFIFHYKRQCNLCSCSNGEKIIYKYLTKNKYIFLHQYPFGDCRDKRPLPFDFAIFVDDKTILIEYQGRHHYESVTRFGGEENLLLVKEHDQIKFDYCNQNNIKLICIPYWDMKNIDQILDKKLQFLIIV